jgi:hypothetical protein
MSYQTGTITNKSPIKGGGLMNILSGGMNIKSIILNASAMLKMDAKGLDNKAL